MKILILLSLYLLSLNCSTSTIKDINIECSKLITFNFSNIYLDYHPSSKDKFIDEPKVKHDICSNFEKKNLFNQMNKHNLSMKINFEKIYLSKFNLGGIKRPHWDTISYGEMYEFNSEIDIKIYNNKEIKQINYRNRNGKHIDLTREAQSFIPMSIVFYFLTFKNGPNWINKYLLIVFSSLYYFSDGFSTKSKIVNDEMEVNYEFIERQMVKFLKEYKP